MEYWQAGADSGVPEIMKGLLGHHPDLVLVEDEIAVVFREKASKRGGKVVLGNAKKAPGLVGVLGDTDYKFVLELAYDEWSTLTGKQKTGLIDHMLCACGVEENPQTGNMKCFIRTPDVAYFWDELDRQGDWRPRGDEGEAHPMAGKIAEMFGPTN
jgi:hypothetical protein